MERIREWRTNGERLSTKELKPVVKESKVKEDISRSLGKSVLNACKYKELVKKDEVNRTKTDSVLDLKNKSSKYKECVLDLKNYRKK